jgi:hypothetical protein
MSETNETKKRSYTRTSKVYVVSHPDQPERLVRATTRLQALQHVTSGYTVDLATQDDIIEMMAAGVAVETAQ